MSNPDIVELPKHFLGTAGICNSWLAKTCHLNYIIATLLESCGSQNSDCSSHGMPGDIGLVFRIEKSLNSLGNFERTNLKPLVQSNSEFFIFNFFDVYIQPGIHEITGPSKGDCLGLGLLIFENYIAKFVFGGCFNVGAGESLLNDCILFTSVGIGDFILKKSLSPAQN